MDYYDYAYLQAGEPEKLTLEYLKIHAITISAKMFNWHDVKVLKVTNKAILFELENQFEYADNKFCAWVAKKVIKLVEGDNNRIYIILPDWYKFKVIK